VRQRRQGSRHRHGVVRQAGQQPEAPEQGETKWVEALAGRRTAGGSGGRGGDLGAGVGGGRRGGGGDGVFDVEGGPVRRRQRRWECGGDFSAWSRSGISGERSLKRCYNGIREKPSVVVYLGEPHSSE
jgi:hypothetical protein